jgi:UDP-N-acetylmuramate dehydrogenase
MSIKREYHVPLSTLSTFRMGAFARQVVTVETESDLKELFASLKPGEKWFVLGGGSNVVFPDGDVDMLIIKLSPNGISIDSDFGDEVIISAGGGVVWDDVVAYAVDKGLCGIEALSAIPGSAGATPVQNVGAYGTEIKDVLVSLEAFDVLEQKTVIFSAEDCLFGYRDSYFKHEGKGRYIITKISLRLSRGSTKIPEYPGVSEYFAKNTIHQPTLLDVRNAITTIRWTKLPDPSSVASVGSFFKNVFVSSQQAEKIRGAFPSLKTFPVNDQTVKIPAGALIDLAGFKGKRFGNLSFYKNNALVIVNEGGATRHELVELIKNVTDRVYAMFGVTLEAEPELM